MTLTISPRSEIPTDKRASLNAIDTDIHQDLGSPRQLLPYLADEWKPFVERGLANASYPHDLQRILSVVCSKGPLQGPR